MFRVSPAFLNTFSHGHSKNLLVLFHAFPLNLTMYHDLLPLLSENWRVILFDFPGFGKSAPFSGRSIALMEDYAVLAYQIIIDEAYDNLVIGGTSMGGYVALAFERLFPRMANGIVLSNTRSSSDTDGGKKREETAKRVEKHGHEFLLQDLMPLLLSPNTLKERPEISAKVEEMIRDASSMGVIQASLGMGRRLDHTPMLEEINIPVLITVGADDQLTPLKDHQIMENRLSDAELFIIPDSGHLSVIENPYYYARILNNYLDSTIL